jgi:phage gp29-like protein
LDALLEPVRQALNASGNLPDFREKLLTLYPDLDGRAFAALMGQALAVADAAGYWEAKP